MSDRRQRQKEQRAAKREAERKQEARKELGRRLITALIFGLVVVAIFAFSGIFSGESTELPGSYEGFRAQETACGAEAPPSEEILQFESPEPQADIDESTLVNAVIETSCGDIVIELDPEASPETVNAFVFLAREGYYDGTVFHRIAESFVIQGGDPQANGTGGPGFVIPDEFPADPEFVYEEGVVAMANRGARSTGSQFFIVIGDDGQYLTNRFNVLGRVLSGKDTLDRIAAIPTGASPGSVEQSLPLETVYMDAVVIEVVDS